MQTIEKALEVLEEFLNQGDGTTLSELAKIKGLSVSTVHRIVSIFTKKGYLHQKNRRGKYFLGPKFLEFVTVLKTSMKLEDLAYSSLKDLNHLIGEMVHLSVLKGNVAVDTIIIPSDKKLRLQIDFRMGQELSLYCTAVGKVFLSNMSGEDLNKYFTNNTLEANTRHTITDINKLKDQLSAVKQNGIAFDSEEWELGVSGVAAPIKDRHGEIVAAAGIAGPSVRLTPNKLKKSAEYLKNCALQVSRILGYEDHPTIITS